MKNSDRNLLTNIYRLMVIMRNDIRNPNNLQICKCIISTIDLKENNEVFLNKIAKLPLTNQHKDFLCHSCGESMNLYDKYIHVLKNSITKIYNCLYTENYDYAYDLVDAFHIFPEVLSSGNKLRLMEYWKTHLKPLSSKYGKADFKEIKKWFSYF